MYFGSIGNNIPESIGKGSTSGYYDGYIQIGPSTFSQPRRKVDPNLDGS